MTTEEEARGLLAKAAASIDVEDAAPPALTGLGEPGTRRWPVLAAAAAVVLAVGGGVAVAQQLGGDDAPTTNLADRTSAVDQSTNPPSLPGDGDRLPSLVGYTEAEATELLQDRGHPLEVQVVPDGCDVAGIVRGSSPPPGTAVSPSHPVTIRVVGEQAVIDCVGEVPMDIVWDVVRAARGLADPASLEGVDFPEDVREAVEAMMNGQPGGESQELVAVWGFDRHPCWSDGVDGIRFFMQGGRDDLVCPQVSTVVEFEGDVVESVRTEGAVVEDITEAELEASLKRLASARKFVQWARGEGPAPTFADRVRLVGAGFHPAWLDEPENRSIYAGCSGLGFPDCGIDPVAAIYNAEGRIRVFDGSACASERGLPRWLADAIADQVRLALPTDTGCNALVVLWIDEDGVVYGVTQVGSPQG